MATDVRFKPFESSEHPERFFAGLTKAILDDDLIVDAQIDQSLRVVIVHERNLGPFRGWGMMPTLRQALIVAELDYLAGNNKFVSHYLTGSLAPEEPLDDWVLQGNDLYCHKDHNKLIIEAVSNHPDFRSIAYAGEDFGSAYEKLNGHFRSVGYLHSSR